MIWLKGTKFPNSKKSSFFGYHSFRYPLEMHIIHRNSNYSDWDEAVKHRDGVVVLAFLFQVRFVILVERLNKPTFEIFTASNERQSPL